jgi:hypothetical protein
MGARRWIGSWPVHRQAAERDRLGLGAAVKSERGERLAPRVRDADTVTGLPVLRGGLRAERVRQGRQGHPDRGRS